MRIDRTRLDEIHARLGADPSAVADLFQVAYDGLVGYAMWRHRRYGLDEDTARDIAVGALADLARKPSRYDSRRGKGLLGYLFMVVDRDATNSNLKDARRGEILSGHAVELREVGGTSYEADHATAMDARMIAENHGSEIVREPGDAAVLELILDRVRETDAYAQELDIMHWSKAERTREVKRRKDRIEKRLSRLRGEG